MAKTGGRCPECGRLTVIEDFTNIGKWWCNGCGKYLVNYPPLGSRVKIITNTVLPDPDNDDDDTPLFSTDVVVDDFQNSDDTSDDFPGDGGDFDGGGASGDY
jgi:hypothetical protein